MTYWVDSLQRAVGLWMNKFHGCKDYYINISIMWLTKDILALNDVLCGIWDIDPRPSIVWRMIRCYSVCQLLGLPNPCNGKCEDFQIMPKEIFDAVGEHFDNEPKPPFWNSNPDIIDI